MSEHERTRAMQEGRAEFNRQDYFAAHERWEEVWRQADDPERRWLQGLIQIAAGLHHVFLGRSAIADGLLSRGCAKLTDAPDRFDDIDVAAARRTAGDIGDAIRRGDAIARSSVRAI